MGRVYYNLCLHTLFSDASGMLCYVPEKSIVPAVNRRKFTGRSVL